MRATLPPDSYAALTPPPPPPPDMIDVITAPADSLAWEMRDIRGVGRYAIPNYPWWEAERAVILTENLEFNAQQFLFDTILAAHLRFLKKPQGKAREQAERLILARNLSVVRNFLMQTQYGKGGVVTPAARVAIEQLALQTAAMLKRGQGFAANISGMLAYPGASKLDFAHGAEERKGAAAIYRALYHLRYRPGVVRKILQSLNIIPTPGWELPPLEDTPFHPAHLNASLMEAEEPVSAATPPPRGGIDLPVLAGVESLLEAEDISAEDGMQLSVNSLSEALKREAIDIAHDILRNLKVQFEQVPLREMINLDPNLLRDSFDDMDIVIQIYETYLEMAANAKPAILEDELIMEANTAIGKLMYQAKRFELQQAMRANDGTNISRIHQELGTFPRSMSHAENESVSSVLTAVEKGLDKVLGVLRTNTVEAPGENALGRGGGRTLGGPSDQEMQLAQLVGMGEEYQRMMAQQQQQQLMIAQQTHLATQQQQMQRQQQQQRQQDRGTGGQGQVGQASSQADLRRQQQRQQRQQQMQRQQQRLQQLRQQQRQQQAKQEHYEHLLHGDDLHHLRDSLNKPMTGELIQPGNAKETIKRERERLDKQRQGKSEKPEGGKVAAPPPRPGASAPTQASPHEHESDISLPPRSPEDPNRPPPPRKQRSSR